MADAPRPLPVWQPSTVAVTAGRPPHEPDRPLNEPLTMASTYVAGGDVEYGRYGNPTWAAFETALGELEGGRCLAFSSGLAAVATVLDLVGHDATVVAPRHAYTGSIMQLADHEALYLFLDDGRALRVRSWGNEAWGVIVEDVTPLLTDGSAGA